MSVFGRAARGVAVSLANLIKGGDVKRSYFDASGAVHKVQATMLDPDDVDTMPVYGDQGVAFRLPVDAEVLVAHAMADAGLGTVIGTSQRGKRPTEKPGGGEVPEGAGGLHYLGAWRVYLDDAGRVFLAGAEDTSEPAILGETFVSLYDAHVHPSPFGPTGTPTVSAATAKSTKVYLA